MPISRVKMKFGIGGKSISPVGVVPEISVFANSVGGRLNSSSWVVYHSFSMAQAAATNFMRVKSFSSMSDNNFWSSITLSELKYSGLSGLKNLRS